MKTAEKAGRFFFTVIGIFGVFLLILPHIGISVDSVMSGSMEPILKTGGIVFTDTRKQIPEEGEIITYQIGANKVTHRVIRKVEQGYVTKGDANNKEDPAIVTADQILGTVFFTLPYLGYLAVFVRQRTIFVILAVMIAQEMLFLLVQWKGERGRKRAEKIYEK